MRKIRNGKAIWLGQRLGWVGGEVSLATAIRREIEDAKKERHHRKCREARALLGISASEYAAIKMSRRMKDTPVQSASFQSVGASAEVY